MKFGNLGEKKSKKLPKWNLKKGKKLSQLVTDDGFIVTRYQYQVSIQLPVKVDNLAVGTRITVVARRNT